MLDQKINQLIKRQLRKNVIEVEFKNLLILWLFSGEERLSEGIKTYVVKAF